MTMSEINSTSHVEDSEFDAVDLSGRLSSTRLDSSSNITENLTADKLLDELSSSTQPSTTNRSLYLTSNNTSHNTYDQFFEEVSLDLPRDNDNANQSQNGRFTKFMPRRGGSDMLSSSNNANSSNGSSSQQQKQQNASKMNSNGATSSEISGPFYSISDVLEENNNTSNGMPVSARESGEYESIDMNRTSFSDTKAARRNVGEPDVVAASGGVSLGHMRKKPTLNPFKRSQSISQKPSPLETVISKTRPRMLPPKDPQEEKKHLQEYEKMMKKAKKIELKRQKDQSRKREEKDKKINRAIHTWENDILPNWKSRANDRNTIVLWEQGIPPRCRKQAWNLKIGNSLNISKQTFAGCLRKLPLTVKRKPVLEDRSHGAPMPITADNSIKTYDPYSNGETPLYNIRRQRRTSSLDVLRETNTIAQVTRDEAQDTIDGRSSSNYSFASEDEETGLGSLGGRSAMEIELKTSGNDGVIELEEDDSSSLDEDDEDITDEQDDDDKTVLDPATLNFLNKAINEDILRTLPSLCVFQPDGPLFVSLRKVLHAYVGYRPNMTYPRGTSFLAGTLLFNMNTQETFVSLINLIRKSQVLYALYNSDEKKIQGFFKVFNVIFAENLPKLYLHFKNLTLTPENYLPDWFMTIFASIVPLELSSRLWDIYLLHGDIILFRSGLVVLKYLEPLLWGGGFSETVKILNMGFIGEHRGEEVKAALAVSGHITDGEEAPFFDEVLGRKGVNLYETRFNELLDAHVPRT